ncbi:substrate-binding domain-containing protein [Clostridium cellulovorans]|uniref:Periplasmic binding protein/LacI transcriptional regulator n=1 Tax=Clostridium cellulovorans (strain ATCC 35296 / DSM 3052 / OCM 3 / 743B) TaxID=573061 RepID=D9SPN9_CLOC7|nr:substrate-binding domain-containing protein [Clostridium cellulovorans]ADL50088.1 periplasmic binding protein/LacI transcriptional regulator [Clostridium cellulovorans 743B]
MKFLKKSILLATITILLLNNANHTTNAKDAITNEKPFKVAVFVRDINNLLLADVKEKLEEIEKESSSKVDFIFIDSKWDQGIQNQNIQESLDKGYDLFVVNPVSANADEIKGTVSKVVTLNIPVILFLPTSSSLTKSFENLPRVAIIARDLQESGVKQGKILANVWKENKDIIDKNKNNILEYAILQGAKDHLSTIERTKYSIQTLTEENIQVKQLFATTCNWDKECARLAIESAFLTLSSKIEAIICNNDEMAMGAIEALQKYGYNKGDKSKYIPVVGVGGLSIAKELISQGAMTGTVVEDVPTHVKAIYDIGLNLISGRSITYGTNLKATGGNVIIIPYEDYIYNPKL